MLTNIKINECRGRPHTPQGVVYYIKWRTVYEIWNAVGGLLWDYVYKQVGMRAVNNSDGPIREGITASF